MPGVFFTLVLSCAALFAQDRSRPAGPRTEVATEEQPEVRPPVVRPLNRRKVYSTQELRPNPETVAKVESLISEILLPEVSLDLDPKQSQLIRTKRPVLRFSVTDPQIVEVVQFSPTEFELIGGEDGHTSLTLWFGERGERPEVRVAEDEEVEDRARAEYGDLPVLGAVFSRRSVDRAETELIILVSPELIHPMDVEECPLILPGMEVTEPNDWEFFLHSRYEDNPECHHRSTVWPIQKELIVDAHHQALVEAKLQPRYQKSQDYYLHGPHGFSR